VSQPPLEEVTLHVQPLDILFTAQKAMVPAVMVLGLPLAVARALVPVLLAGAVVMAVARAMMVMTAAARHDRLLSVTC